MKGSDPDASILRLVDFSTILAAKESYLEAISQRMEIISAITFLLSQSDYLSRILMGNPECLESLMAGESVIKTHSVLMEELGHSIERYGLPSAIRLLKRLEEIRLGILFLDRKISVRELTKSLSRVAEAVLTTLRRPTGLGIAGLGKLGGREITFNSDLDIIFITSGEPEIRDVKAAEGIIKTLMSYTREGIAYSVDTRLRPDGNKGPLVSSLSALREYYTRAAQPWELQALLKARPMGGSPTPVSSLFVCMRNEILMERGREVTAEEIRRMRERIQRELSKESASVGAYDIKLGKGGLEDLEFAVQCLQLRHCRDNPAVLVQGTQDAITRLMKGGFLTSEEAGDLDGAYTFYRTVETMLRLRSETVLKEGGDTLKGVALFMDKKEEDLLETLHTRRKKVNEIWERLTA
ncbi:MAG: hypothetical protein HGA78_12745 [Nitrospirales bacterium]|nr:hypothetical protein [Nitrospirales bacterium]